MKLMIVSDIHGDAGYCEKMLKQFEAEQADKLLILGDILYHGPRNAIPENYAPKKVIEQLNAFRQKILCVRGNCDTEVDQMTLAFPIMADYCLLFGEGRTVFATHGHRYNTENLPALSKGDILLHGHTHVPAWQPFGEENYYLNPGSLSIPKENSPHGYMIWEKDTFLWKELSGTVYHRLTPGEENMTC